MLKNVLAVLGCVAFSISGCVTSDDDASIDIDDNESALITVTVPACTATGPAAAKTKISTLRQNMSFGFPVGSSLNTVNPMNCDATIMTAATYHAAYLANCRASYDHMEKDCATTTCTQCERDRFYATGFGLRMSRAGFTGNAKSETGAPATTDSSLAIDRWMDTAFHRLPFMDYRGNRFGVGAVAKPTTNTTGVSNVTMDFGAFSPTTTVANTNIAAIYPYNNQVGVKKSFLCSSEGPNPCDYAIPGVTRLASSTTTGYPIAYMRPASDLTVTSHTLRRDTVTGATVAHHWIDSTATNTLGRTVVSGNQWIFLPDAPLAANTKYFVKIVGTIKNSNPVVTITASWSFTTGA